jgi:hypothetical protein
MARDRVLMERQHYGLDVFLAEIGGLANSLYAFFGLSVALLGHWHMQEKFAQRLYRNG